MDITGVFSLNGAAKEKFRVNANKLLNECFILKSCEDTKSCYYYILKEKDNFRIYFDFLGYELNINEDLGVIALNNTYGNGRIRLRLIDSIILLFIRLIYIEERQKLSQTEQIITTVEEIYERYRGLKNERLNKRDMKDCLRLLKKYHIIHNLDYDLSNPETRIIIYPSVILAFDSSELNAVYESAKQKLDTYMNGGVALNNAGEEDTDET